MCKYCEDGAEIKRDSCNDINPESMAIENDVLVINIGGSWLYVELKHCFMCGRKLTPASGA